MALGIAGFVANPAQAATEEEELEVIVSRLREYYLEQGDEILLANNVFLAKTSEAMDYVAAQNADGSWDDVDYADRTSSANGSIWSAYKALYRMMAMSQAYRDPGNEGFEDPALVEGVERALLHWDEVDPGNQNWWETEIGESIAMGRVTVFLRDEISAEAREVIVAHNEGSLDPVGANGAWRTTNYIFRAMAEENYDDIHTGMATMVKTVAVDRSGKTNEAVQPDASFWAHGAQLYSEGYGMALFTNVALWADATRGTSFAFTRDHLDTIAFYIISGTRWMIRGDLGMLYLGYRRPKTVEGITSHASEFIEPLRMMVRSDALYATSYQALLDNITGDSDTAGVTGNKYFWRSEYSSHQRDDYGVFTKLNSSRTIGGEYRLRWRPEIGNEIDWNASGATAIHVTGREQFDLGPAFDWLHYPGVTAPYLKVTRQGQIRNGGSFTGGVSDGEYGANVFTLDRADTKASKSYFYFDDEIVALGTGIESSADAPVHTTVNQSVAKANASVNGTPLASGTSERTVDSPAWAYNDQVGYVFPEEGPLKVSNKTQTGHWIDEDPQSADAFTLYFDHGRQPEDAGYEYIVLPAKQPEQVEAYADDPAVEVLRNDAQVQAVRHADLERTSAVFYEAGELDLGDGRTLSLSQPGLVMLDESGDLARVSVSNPERPGISVRVALSGEDTFAEATVRLGLGPDLGKTVSAELASSEPGESSDLTASASDDGHLPALAGDRDLATEWRTSQEGAAWLRKELEPGSFVTGATISWGEDHAKHYLVQTSLDGTNWTDRQFVKDGAGGEETLEFAPAMATYVRVLMLDSATGQGQAIRELDVQASVNLALGRTATASGGTGGSATDGNMDTRWQGNLSDDAWLQVDLGSVQPIGAVRLWWEASYAKRYAIQVSDDGTNWREAARTGSEGSDGGLDVIAVDERARFVRMQSIERSTTRYGASMWEFEVFADDALVDAPTTSAGRENLALGRPIEADSAYDSSSEPRFANDGNNSTRWSSERESEPYTIERWLEVDLEDERTINQAVILWEAATSNDFRIEGSDDGDEWTELAHVQKSSDQLRSVVDFDSSEARYVRVIGLPVTKYGLSVFEFELYGGYNLTCEAPSGQVGPGSEVTAQVSIAPHDQGDELEVFSLDTGVVSLAEQPSIGENGRAELDLITGRAGSTSLLVTHANGDEYAWCPINVGASTSDLEALVERANALDSTQYTAESWAPLLPALEHAKDLLAAADATQEQIDAAASDLAAALDGLVELGDELSVPSAPREVAARVADGVVQVSWQEPSDDGGAPVTEYEVTVGDEVITVGADERSASVTGLAPGSYEVSVRAANSEGWSEPSAGVTVEITGPGESPSPDPTVSPSPDPSPSPTSSPSPDPTSDPSADPSPTQGPTPTSGPSEDPGPGDEPTERPEVGLPPTGVSS